MEPGRSLMRTYGRMRVASRVGSSETRSRADTSPIALMLDHDASLVTGILGTLMAGHPYVALDRAFPAKMVRQILGDSGARAMVISDPGPRPGTLCPTFTSSISRRCLQLPGMGSRQGYLIPGIPSAFPTPRDPRGCPRASFVIIGAFCMPSAITPDAWKSRRTTAFYFCLVSRICGLFRVQARRPWYEIGRS